MDNEFFNFDEVIEIEKKKSYNQALEDFVKKCENAKFYQFGQHYVDIRDIREFKKELSR